MVSDVDTSIARCWLYFFLCVLIELAIESKGLARQTLFISFISFRGAGDRPQPLFMARSALPHSYLSGLCIPGVKGGGPDTCIHISSVKVRGQPLALTLRCPLLFI